MSDPTSKNSNRDAETNHACVSLSALGAVTLANLAESVNWANSNNAVAIDSKPWACLVSTTTSKSDSEIAVQPSETPRLSETPGDSDVARSTDSQVQALPEQEANDRIEQEAAAERVEKDRAEAERIEKERVEKERAESDLAERQRAEAELVEKHQAEAERAAKEQSEAERAEKERAEKEQADKERAEAEVAAEERAEAERAAKARAEAENAENARAESERVESERVESERLEAERAVKELASKRQAENEKAEQARTARERAEKELADAKRAESERANLEIAEQEKAERARTENERAREGIEKRQLAAKERLLSEQAAQDRGAEIQAEKKHRDEPERNDEAQRHAPLAATTGDVTRSPVVSKASVPNRVRIPAINSPANAATIHSPRPASDEYLNQLEQLVLQLNLELALPGGSDHAGSYEQQIQALTQRLINLSLENLQLRRQLASECGA